MESTKGLSKAPEVKISIDQDIPTEEEEVSGDSRLTQRLIPIENACSQCATFRANADHAWDVLREFQRKNEENKKLKNEVYQLDNQLIESRNYISTLRQQQQDYNEIIKEKDLLILRHEERISNLELQYDRVLKAGNEGRKTVGELRQQQQDYIMLFKEKDQMITERDKKIANLEFYCNKKQKAASEMPVVETASFVQNYVKNDIELEGDDLFLELPPSPPMQNSMDLSIESLPPVRNCMDLSIESIFRCRFFLEYASLSLIEDLDAIDVCLMQEESFSKNDEPRLDVKLTGSAPLLEIRQISKKYNVDKKQAALLYTQAKRDLNKQTQRKRRRSELSDDEDDEKASVSTSASEKKLVPRNLLPWIPHKKVIPSDSHKSIFSFDDHKRYVGIVVNQLKSIPTFRFEQNKIEIQAMDDKLKPERAFYEKTAMQAAKHLLKPFNLDPSHLKIFVEHNLSLINLYIGKLSFQGVLLSIPWSNGDKQLEDQVPSKFHFRVSEIVSHGNAKIIRVPDIHRKFLVDNRPNTIRGMLEGKRKIKKPIVEDKQLIEYALIKGVQVLMDASTLRHLLSATWSQRLQHYACRVTVTTSVFSGKLCSLCIVTPPLIASRIHKTAIQRSFAKWGIKAHLLGKSNLNEEAKTDNKQQMSDSCQSLLNDLGLSNFGKVNEENFIKRCAIVSFDDPKLEDSAEQRKSHQILIRTSLHAYEDIHENQDNSPHLISFSARAEFLPEVGAEQLTSEEEIWNFVTGLLKGSNEHLNFRIKVAGQRQESAVLQYDRRDPKYFRLSEKAKCLLAARIQRINNLTDELAKLSIGEYLLMQSPDGGKLQILKQAGNNETRCNVSFGGELKHADFEEGGSARMNNLWEPKSRSLGPCSFANGYFDALWFERTIRSKVISSPREFEEYWNGIDPHYPLQWHVLKSQIPGALYPRRT